MLNVKGLTDQASSLSASLVQVHMLTLVEALLEKQFMLYNNGYNFADLHMQKSL